MAVHKVGFGFHVSSGSIANHNRRPKAMHLGIVFASGLTKNGDMIRRCDSVRLSPYSRNALDKRVPAQHHFGLLCFGEARTGGMRSDAQ